MNRHALEVADILRMQGQRFLDRYRASFDFQQLKACCRPTELPHRRARRSPRCLPPMCVDLEDSRQEPTHGSRKKSQFWANELPFIWVFGAYAMRHPSTAS